jgi:hypothetical protein
VLQPAGKKSTHPCTTIVPAAAAAAMTGQIENEGKKYMFGPRKEEIFKIRKQLVAVGIQTFAPSLIAHYIYTTGSSAKKQV